MAEQVTGDGERNGTSVEATGMSQARLEGIHLAARAATHYLINDLSGPVGFIELLQSRFDLPSDARQMLGDVEAGLNLAVEHIRAMARVKRVVTRDGPTGPLLDLESSTD